MTTQEERQQQVIQNLELTGTFAGIPTKYWKIGLGVGIAAIFIWTFYKKGNIY